MHYFFLCLFCFIFFNSIEGGQLLERLDEAEAGDYIVMSQQKNYTLFRIDERVGSQVTIEEVSIGQGAWKVQGLTWREWYEAKAPRHESWIVYQVDLQKGALNSYYSVTRDAWIELDQTEVFLSTLLQLQFDEVPTNERRKIGAATPGGGDRRKVWNPPLVIEGDLLRDVPFTAWKAYWPTDGSELAGKALLIYLPEEENLAPTYLPYWIQLHTEVKRVHARAVDSGKNLLSSQRRSFFRYFEFLSMPHFTGEGLFLEVNLYGDNQIKLYAYQESVGRYDLIELPYTLQDNHAITLFVSGEALQRHLEQGAYYHFVLASERHKENIIETDRAYRFVIGE